MATVVDANVVVYAHLNVPESEAAATALAEAGSVLAPDFVLAEVANAAWLAAQAGAIPPETGRAIVRLSRAHYTRLVPTSMLARRA